MIQIIGWTILHSLWQITLIAALYWIAKLCIQKRNASTQYNLGICALLTALIAPICTFYYLWSEQATPFLAATLIPISDENINPTVLLNTNDTVPLVATSFIDYLPILFPYLVAFWGLGVIYFTIRFVKNINGVTQLQNADNELISRDWRTKITTFVEQLGIEKNVQVYLSTSVKEPLTFGHFKPVILLPISLITGFDAKAIETILLHELAHIKRHDYLVNLGQSIIEIILFYHPLVWWLSHEIRTVREHCCDDLVLKMGDNRTTYVEALTALQWRKIGAATNRLSMTAIGEEGNFSRRIKRMFRVEEQRFSTKRFLILIGLFFLLSSVGTSIYQQITTNEVVGNIAEQTILIINDKTTKAELQDWEKKAKQQHIKLDFSPSVFDEKNQLVEVRGSYSFEGNSGDFFSANLPCTNVKFVFEDKHLSQPVFLYPCIDKAAEEMGNIFHVNESTERKDLQVWAKKLANNNISFKFNQSVFDNKGKIIEFNANYRDENSSGSFSATDMSCSKFHFELVGNTLVGPNFVKDGEESRTLGMTAKPLHLSPNPALEKVLKNIEIDFKNAESDFSKGRIPAFQNTKMPKKANNIFLEKPKFPSFQEGFFFPKDGNINNKPTFINGVKYETSWMPEIRPENIESVEVVKGISQPK